MEGVREEAGPEICSAQGQLFLLQLVVNLLPYRDPTLTFPAQRVIKKGHHRLLDELKEAPSESHSALWKEACKYGHVCVVQMIVDTWLSIDLGHPFTLAISRGKVECVRFLLSRDIGLLCYDNGFICINAVVIAVNAGQLGMVKYLIEEATYNPTFIANHRHGDDPYRSGQTKTPLVSACENEDVAMVSYLLSAGADPKLRCTVGTPLEVAAMAASKKVFFLIWNYIFPPPVSQAQQPHQSQPESGEKEPEEATGGGEGGEGGVVDWKYKARKKWLRNVMTMACMGGSTRIVSHLLKFGVDPDAEGLSIDHTQTRPIFAALRAGTCWGGGLCVGL